MSIYRVAIASIGFLMSAFTVWKIVRRGIAERSGNIETIDVSRIGTGQP
jgi:hypothetical protein